MQLFKVFIFFLILAVGSAAQPHSFVSIETLVSYAGRDLNAIPERDNGNDFPISNSDNKAIKAASSALLNDKVDFQLVAEIYSALTNWTACYVASHRLVDSTKALATKSAQQYFPCFKSAISKKVFDANQAIHIMDYPSEICARFIIGRLLYAEENKTTDINFYNQRSLFMWKIINEWIDPFDETVKNSFLLANKMLFDKIFRHPDSVLADLTWIAIQFASTNDINTINFLKDLNANYSTDGGCYPGYRNRLVEYIFTRYTKCKDDIKDSSYLDKIQCKIKHDIPNISYCSKLLKNFYDLRKAIINIPDEKGINPYLEPILYSTYYYYKEPNEFESCVGIQSLCCKLDEVYHALSSKEGINTTFVKEYLKNSASIPNNRSRPDTRRDYEYGGRDQRSAIELQKMQDKELAWKFYSDEQEIILKDRELAQRIALEEDDFGDESDDDLASYLASLNIPNSTKPQDIEYDSDIRQYLPTSDNTELQDIEDDSDDEDLRWAIRESKLETAKLRKISSNSHKSEYKSKNQIFLEEPLYNDGYNNNDFDLDIFSKNSDFKANNYKPQDSYCSNIINDLPGLKQELINLRNTENVDHLNSLLLICQGEDNDKVLESKNRPACIKLALEILNRCESIVKSDYNLQPKDIYAILQFFTNNALSDISIADDIFIKNNNLDLEVYNGQDLKQYLKNLRRNDREIQSLRNAIDRYKKAFNREEKELLSDESYSKSACMQKIVAILNNFPRGVTLNFSCEDISKILNFLTGDIIDVIVAEDAYLANQNYKFCRVAALYNQAKGYYNYNNEIAKLLENKTVVNILTRNIQDWRKRMINNSLDDFIQFVNNIKIDHTFSSFDMFEILLQIRGGVLCDPSIAVDIWLYVVQYLL